jgi:hypothetical protein
MRLRPGGRNEPPPAAGLQSDGRAPYDRCEFNAAAMLRMFGRGGRCVGSGRRKGLV